MKMFHPVFVQFFMRCLLYQLCVIHVTLIIAVPSVFLKYCDLAFEKVANTLLHVRRSLAPQTAKSRTYVRDSCGTFGATI
jgi:hypothetical protein